MEKENLPKWDYITKEELTKIYKTKSKYEISKMFNISDKEVNKKLKEFNIKWHDLVAEDFTKECYNMLKKREG